MLLIVEDHAPLRALLHDWLGRAFTGCPCRVAASGEEALRVVAAERPRAVLLDIDLPDMSGLEVLRQIRTMAPEIAVVMLTVHAEAIYEADARHRGARAYVRKDRMRAELLPLLSAVLEGCGTEQAPDPADFK